MTETAALKKSRVIFAVLAVLFGVFMMTAKIVYYNAVELPRFAAKEEALNNPEPLESTGDTFADTLIAVGVGVGRGGGSAGLDIAESLTWFFMITGVLWFSVYTLLAALFLRRPPKWLPVGRLILTVISAFFIFVMLAGALLWIALALWAAVIAFWIVYIVRYVRAARALKTEPSAAPAQE